MATSDQRGDSHVLRVLEVVAETADACSVVLEVPPEAREAFAYRPGQFLTVAVPSDLTGVTARCYSLSSSPLDGGPLTITVKRTAQGYVSNWICDQLRPGASLRVLPPGGVFTPASLDADLLLFAAGSGVSPLISIARSALAGGAGRIVVLYANRDESSVIFATEWARLAALHPDRLTVVHWLESLQGLPTQAQLAAFARQYLTFDAFVCGPPPFMKATMAALKLLGFPKARRHQEKFVSLHGNPFDVERHETSASVVSAELDLRAQGDSDGDAGTDEHDQAAPVVLEVELDGESHTFDDWSRGCTLLEFLEGKGLKAPYSCREGECSACEFRLLEGEVAMLRNDVLEPEDLADGLRLGCQSLPVTDRVRATYA